jgi:ABC-2 type transport system permease protein
VGSPVDRKHDPRLEHEYLKYELDRYLRGRAGETRHEPPLSRVQREPYVWYQKGALVMYALRDYVGEEKLNGP